MIWTLESLQAMSEEDLCEQVLVPLFEAMGFKDVQYQHGGILEQGKDFVMWRDEPPKGRVNYAVVAKAEKITGTPASAGGVVTQVKQCRGRRFIDKKSLKEEAVHQCIVVSSQEIKKEGSYTLHTLFQEDRLEGFAYAIDGDELWKLVKQYLPGKVILSSLETAYSALDSIHPDYSVKVEMRPGERRFSLEPRRPDAKPIEVSIDPKFDDSPEGRERRSKFEQYVKSGTPIELDQTNVSFSDLPEFLQMLFPFAESSPFSIVMGPVRPCRPILMLPTVLGMGTDELVLPVVDFTANYSGTESMTMSNDEQPIPLKVRLEIFNSGRVNFTYTLQLGGQSVYWLDLYLKIESALYGGGRHAMRNLVTGVMLPILGNIPREKPDEEFYLIVQDVLAIQDTLGVQILVPQREYFTDEDVDQIALVKGIIETGRYPVPPGSINIELSDGVEAAKNVLAIMRDGDNDVRFGRKDYFERLLDNSVSLGPAEVIIPKARVHPEDLEKLERSAAEKLGEAGVKLRIMAGEGEVIKVVFPKWANRQVASEQGESGGRQG